MTNETYCSVGYSKIKIGPTRKEPEPEPRICAVCAGTGLVQTRIGILICPYCEGRGRETKCQ